MNKFQQTYTAFMESVCTKFNRTEMFPVLKKGFKAFCEASTGIPTTFKEFCASDEKLNAINAKMRANEAQYDELYAESSELNKEFIRARRVADQHRIKQQINEIVTTMGTLAKEDNALTDEYNKRLTELRGEYDASKS